MNIYCQKQIGDLCRMHSINNYFGKEVINQEVFKKYCNEYDSLIYGLKSIQMDGFAEGRSIVSYIIEKLDNKFLLLIPIKINSSIRNHLDLERYNKLMKNNNFTNYFEFNKNHIWINRKINGQYYKIDSISGVNMIEPNKLGNNGYFLVFEDFLLYDEILHHFKILTANKLQKIEYDTEIIIYNLYFMLNKINTSSQFVSNTLKKDKSFTKSIFLIDKIKILITKLVQSKRKYGSIDKINDNNKRDKLINIFKDNIRILTDNILKIVKYFNEQNNIK